MTEYVLSGSVNEDARLERIQALVHDMRTPLATISASNEMLEQFEGNSEAAVLLEVIHRQVCRLDVMLRELTQVAGLSVRAPAVRGEELDLVALAGAIVMEYRVLRTGHRFIFEPVMHQLLANLEEAHVRRILQNLLDNAVAYSPPGSSICVRLRLAGHDGSEVLIEVEDEGEGVPDSSRQEIFNPFSRLQSSPGSGNGLGLYIVRCLADANQGKAWVESGSVGALFKVCLPRYEASSPGLTSSG